ncbi:actin-related protein 10-like [Centruroides sculpturatus]|uniref:actin-related protein 10-like n=1 Tax=Centruroides sculpturatus TaxID=218467 RepID=UPI000C6D6DE1|nr:actin-related protein 10-like [Centruroides sculpturatus]
MPRYEGYVVAADKYPIILDIGSAYTKCGFARETGPRWIISSEVKNSQTGKVTKLWDYKSPEELYLLFKEFLQQMYFKYVVANPKERRVVIVESVVCPTVFRETLAKVLFHHFEIPSLIFVPAHLMSLFTLGITTALILDVGYNETAVLPVYEGVTLLRAWQGLPLGGHAIHRRIELGLMENGKIKVKGLDEVPLTTVLTEPLKESVFEDIKVRTCFVTTLERGQKIQEHEASKKLSSPVSVELPIPPHDIQYPLDGERILTIPGYIREWAAEMLFEQDGEEQNVATIILDSILKCPTDVRVALAENIIVMGGTAMLPGFKHRLMTEIKLLLTQKRYANLPIKSIKFHNPPCKENYTAWLGAAIFGATDAISKRSISREQFNQHGIPDWSDHNWDSSGKSLA